MVEGKSESISEAEAELYDRQIRLWGLDAQRRLRAAKVLIVGAGGLAAEVAKNIVLAGIKALTFLDHRNVEQGDFAANFLLAGADIGKNRAVSCLENTQKLNSMVEVRADKDDISTKPDSYFTHFDVVLITQCSQEQMTRVNEVCHKNDIKFYAGDVYGWYGFMFADLNEHHYAEDIQKLKAQSQGEGDEPAVKKSKSAEMETVTVKQTSSFVRLRQALNADFSSEKYKKSLKRTPHCFFIIKAILNFLSTNHRTPSVDHLETDIEQLVKFKNDVLTSVDVNIDDDFGRYCFSELSPVCAVVGGVLGQEIIKGVSQKDSPHNNFFLYNGVDGNGMVDCFA